MSKTAFERYAPFIQKYIYRKKWTDLREVQVDACEAILDTDNHVIIASGTASGKTEAAFFPVLTLLEQSPSASIGVLYIGPLKALINDQFERLNELLEEEDIPVWPWHGDISQATKNKALKQARGVLQITPESLEALLMKRPGEAQKLFSDLKFVIIDEIHAFMGEDRGLQLLCLISRLEKITGCRPRRIGLSATLNDYRPAMEFLSSGSNVETVAVGIKHHKRTISICAESFNVPDDENEAKQIFEKYNNFIYDNCFSKKCLLFTNSRGKAEKLIASMKDIAAQRQDKDVFYVHHGSVSATLRHEAEIALKSNIGPTVAAATLTLELGIDIGDLDSTIQVGAPYTCSSFVQRLGRSGRRTGKSQMMFVNLHEEKNSSPYDKLPWDLLRSIAVIQLYLEERWVEPFVQKKKPYSLLAHQTLSTLMTYYELSPSSLAKTVLLLPVFKNTISQDEYRTLLIYMLENNYIEKLDNGNLIVGLKGEKITNHYSFYSVFQEEESYCVKSKDSEIGSLSTCPAIDEVFVLGGKSWKVVSIDENSKTVYVTQTKSTNIPSWNGEGGDIHSKIVQRMKKVLQEETIYPYLQPNAIILLSDARKYAKESGILNKDIVVSNHNGFYIAPWVGSKELRSLSLLFTYGLKDELRIYSVVNHYHCIHITSDYPPKQFVDKFNSTIIDIDNPDIVLPNNRNPLTDKYDFMVPDNLLRKAFLYNQTDINTAISIMKNILI